jgi:general stress protein 26
MDKQVTDFLDSEHLGALTIVTNDGTLHPATMHFSYTTEPQFKIYFSTDRNTRKAEKIRTGGSAPAAIVIGFSEEHWTTFQAAGEIYIIQDKDEETKVKELHYTKNPGSARYKDDPSTVMLAFTPKWWKFTNYKAKPMVVFQS